MSKFSAPEVGDCNSADILSSIDAFEIENFFIHDKLCKRIESQPESAAKRLYLELDKIQTRTDAEEILKRRTVALSHEDKALYAKYLTIRNTCKSAASIIAVGNAAAADPLNLNNVSHMIGEMKKKSITSTQLGTVLGTITHWKTGTSHPTQHLSEAGKTLFRDLLGITNLSAEKRVTSAEQTIESMLDETMTRANRMDVREEKEIDRAQAKLHRKAMRQTYHELQAALNKHYPTDAPNLLAENIHMTLCYHTWNGGGDADGKPNADKKALLEGMVGYTIDAIKEHLEDINKAFNLDQSLAERLQNTKASLETVFKRLNALEKKLYDKNDEANFDDLKSEYADVYKKLRIDDAKNGFISVNSEQDMYEALTQGLRHIINQEEEGPAKDVLSDTLFVMRQYKNTFTTAKIEKRANDPIDVNIMNQLFGDRKFQNSFLNGSMKRLLANKVFTRLSHDDQREIMRHVGKKEAKALQEHYRRIFPEGLDDKGFPNQLRERGERLALQAITPNKFGMSIVAEATAMSPEYAFFLGEEMFNVKGMMHTMLNENMETLDKAPDFFIDFTRNSGLKSIYNAAASNPRLADYLQKHGAMLPCSDSVKQLGPGAFYIQAQAINLMMKFAVENNQTICLKWGNGQALTRGGGNAHIPGRLKAQAVQWHLNGRALNLDKADDIKILANVMFSSNTEQGRAADFMSPNAEKISKNHIRMMNEVLGRALELTGKVEKGTYITQVAQFSSGTRRIFCDIAKNIMMRGYENMRDAVDANGNRLSDSVASTVSNMKIAGDANQAARPASKVQKKDQSLHDLRAIGTTIRISHMRTYHDGWFSIGAGLQAIHNAYLDKEINDDDLAAFLEDPLWANMVKNGLRTASMSDLPHTFEQLGVGDWSHEKAMRIGKAVEIRPSDDPKNKPPLFLFTAKDDVTPEQAYAAKLYYDQAMFITYTEKFANMNLQKESLPQSVEEIEKDVLPHLESTDDKIGRFQIGQYTSMLFPFVDQDYNGTRKATLASQILCDVSEECHDELTQEQCNLVTGAQRSAQVWNNADLYTDQDAYGSKPILALFPFLITRAFSHNNSEYVPLQP